MKTTNTPDQKRIVRFRYEVPMSGEVAKPKTAPPMNTHYVPLRNPNYTPSNRVFLTSGQGRVVDKSK